MTPDTAITIGLVVLTLLLWAYERDQRRRLETMVRIQGKHITDLEDAQEEPQAAVVVVRRQDS